MVTYRLIDSTTVKITAGIADDQQTFTIPQEYLIFVSKYFENTFKGSFREATEKAITPGDVEVKTFRLFNEWLMARSLVNSKGEQYRSSSSLLFPDTHELFALYLLADEYEVPQLRRDTLDAYVSIWSNFVCGRPSVDDVQCYDRVLRRNSHGHLTQGFQGLPKDSPMILMLVDLWAYYWRGQLDDGEVSEHEKVSNDEGQLWQCSRVFW